MAASHGRVSRVVLPRAGEGGTRHPFPVFASIAPVIGALVMWAVTSSPFALVFAGLGPVIALASLGDSRMQARRMRRRERVRIAEETQRASEAIRAAHARERRVLERATPGAIALCGPLARPGSGAVGTPGPAPGSPVASTADRWRASLSSAVPVMVGWGEAESETVVEGDGESFPALVSEASVLFDAPMAIDARLGIGVCGPPRLRRAILRSLALQLAAMLPPRTTTITVFGLTEEWIESLPHEVRRAESGPVRVEFADEHGSVAVTESDSTALLPHECRVHLVVDATRTLVSTPTEHEARQCSPEFVSVDQASACARVLRDSAVSGALEVKRLPDSVAFSALPTDAEIDRGALAATFCLAADAPLSIDLVSHGPHAVVGGMTGSGKSELLLSWMLSLATRHPPQEVSLMLVDFKGGASFGELVNLPHVVGVLTDLDERTAERALQSLRAETRRREHMLAEAGARSIAELPSSVELPRLVIVVDEFAALIDGFDELHRLFADIASRGRSLGIHLVLCTQRPAGVVRDAVLANAPLRISLAVNNRADSAAVIGTDAAAGLVDAPRGRAFVSLGGADPLAVQVALATNADLSSVVERWAGAPRAFRPWLDDLPRMIAQERLTGSVGADSLPFGVLDMPGEQSQPVAEWIPRRHGALLVLGAAGSGRTTAIDTLVAEAGGALLPHDADDAWDVLTSLVEDVRAARIRPGLVAVDDVDVTLARLGSDHGPAFVELLVELARTGPSVGVHLAVAMKRVSAGLQSLASCCESRLLLRMPDRQEHLAAGGTPELFATHSPPGRGEWCASAVQVAVTAQRPVAMSPPPAPELHSSSHPLVAIVSRRPRQLARMLDDGYSVSGIPPSASIEVTGRGVPTAIVADPDAWQASWSSLAALTARAAIVFDRCTIAEFRALSGVRSLPPPLRAGVDVAWICEPGGRVARISLARPAPRRADEGGGSALSRQAR